MFAAGRAIANTYQKSVNSSVSSVPQGQKNQLFGDNTKVEAPDPSQDSLLAKIPEGGQKGTEKLGEEKSYFNAVPVTNTVSSDDKKGNDSSLTGIKARLVNQNESPTGLTEKNKKTLNDNKTYFKALGTRIKTQLETYGQQDYQKDYQSKYHAVDKLAKELMYGNDNPDSIFNLVNSDLKKDNFGGVIPDPKETQKLFKKLLMINVGKDGKGDNDFDLSFVTKYFKREKTEKSEAKISHLAEFLCSDNFDNSGIRNGGSEEPTSEDIPIPPDADVQKSGNLESAPISSEVQTNTLDNLNTLKKLNEQLTGLNALLNPIRVPDDTTSVLDDKIITVQSCKERSKNFTPTITRIQDDITTFKSKLDMIDKGTEKSIIHLNDELIQHEKDQYNGTLDEKVIRNNKISTLKKEIETKKSDMKADMKRQLNKTMTWIDLLNEQKLLLSKEINTLKTKYIQVKSEISIIQTALNELRQSLLNQLGESHPNNSESKIDRVSDALVSLSELSKMQDSLTNLEKQLESEESSLTPIELEWPEQLKGVEESQKSWLKEVGLIDENLSRSIALAEALMLDELNAMEETLNGLGTSPTVSEEQDISGLNEASSTT